MPDKPRADPLHSWGERHSDDWITERPMEAVIIGGAVALAGRLLVDVKHPGSIQTEQRFGESDIVRHRRGFPSPGASHP